jgi:hypothetical protein
MVVTRGEQVQQFFTVCIMDMRLLGMEGNASIRSLHALCPNMKFIIHIDFSDYTFSSNPQALGLSDEPIYLKPLIDMASVINAIDILMDVKGKR